MMQTTGDRAAGSVPGTNAQKVRVYEMAKDVGLSNKDLVDKIRGLGIEVKNHMSALEPDDVARVRRALDKERQENTVVERIQPTVIRRRNSGHGTAAVPEPARATPARSASSARRSPLEDIELPHRGPKPAPVEPDEDEIVAEPATVSGRPAAEAPPAREAKPPVAAEPEPAHDGKVDGRAVAAEAPRAPEPVRLAAPPPP